MEGSIFGTDGVRGIANTELTCASSLCLGEAAVKFAGPRIVLGRDTRRSGAMLESCLAAGIMSAGGTPLCANIVPTPAIASLILDLHADGGIMVSASHNPAEYNGIKFFSSQGMKLPDEVEDEISRFVVAGGFDKGALSSGQGVGMLEKIADARERYINHAISTVSCDLSGLTIAVDCAHGASYKTTPEALRRLGANVIAINADYTGDDINYQCGSTHMEAIKKLARECDADVGLAHDGDADRVLFIDEQGEELDGDFILAICGSELKRQGKLKKNEIVSTVMCNLGFVKAMNEQGITVAKTAVGDRYVLERMCSDGAILGGEQSGHVIFLEHNSTGDGLLTALQLLQAMQNAGKPLSELRRVMERFPQELVNVRCERKDELETNNAVKEVIAEVESLLGDLGRVLVRPSGTEPLIRVMVEAHDGEFARKCSATIVRVLESELCSK